MKSFQCTCGNALYFESSRCLACGIDVGYEPAQGVIRRLGKSHRLCGNGQRYAACNWLVPAGSGEAFCLSCRLNRTIPDLGNPLNRQHWSLVEGAKRRLLSTLLSFGLSLPTLAEDPLNGLAFDIVSTTLDPRFTMGHLRGVITVNIEEADDTWRQINRQQLGEASRTLLGHFRHESGHYLWYRFLSRLEWEHPSRTAFRELFGNDSFDYGEALARYYQQGPPAHWQQNYISAYAASHPWEDWAETWAHYLQMVDGIETCEELGIQVESAAAPPALIPLPAGLVISEAGEDASFRALLQRWISLATIMNEISRSFGAPVLYPYVISPSVARKLRLAHHFASMWGDAKSVTPAGFAQSPACGLHSETGQL